MKKVTFYWAVTCVVAIFSWFNVQASQNKERYALASALLTIEEIAIKSGNNCFTEYEGWYCREHDFGGGRRCFHGGEVGAFCKEDNEDKEEN
ncbi:MAG: XK-related protein [Mariniphaga sp.]|nr:XK-related protein [Mariniphaga sp.]